MANFVRGGAGGPRKKRAPRPVQVTKAMAPGGTQQVPIRTNANAERGGPVGGLEDAERVSGAHRQGSRVGRRGQDPNAFQTNRSPSMAPPTPAPGQKGKAKPVPTAPPRLANSGTATGPTSTSGERALRGAAKASRKGTPMPVSGAVRHRAPALPTPTPTFSGRAADNPGGGPTQQPRTGGTMSGTMQGGKGKRTGGTKLQ